MPHIQPLDPHLAELIAAGEVVERPASVVKELVENAIDAGADTITVEIERGGMGLIRVTDNGCGIAPEELPTAFLRHATSKVRELADLSAIGTLGFRGEALAAICAVSRVHIRTREKNAPMGASLYLEGGEHGDVEPIGAPEGTSIEVRDLFFNTPARLKFIRRDSTEAGKIGSLLEQLALSHPEIAFRFFKDGDDILHTPGDGKLLSAIYAAFKREFTSSLIPVDGRGGEIHVNGYVTSPVHGRGSRSMQIFFVNGRFVKIPLLTSALEEAYRNQMLKGRFPGCVLFITMPLAGVDVNVHPAKTQVKFAREQDVFRTVCHVTRDALNDGGNPAGIRTAAEKTTQSGNGYTISRTGTLTGRVKAKPDFFRAMDAKTYREWRDGSASESGVRIQTDPSWDREEEPEYPPRNPSIPFHPSEITGAEVRTPDRPDIGTLDSPYTGTPDGPDAKTTDSPDTRPPDFVPAIPPDRLTFSNPSNPSTLPGQRTLPHAPQPWRIAGEIWRTYIICESAEGTVYLIDKHAAHERVNFDRLKAGDIPPMRQTLLVPEAVSLAPDDAALILEHLELLGRLGFSCEEFGQSTLLVREIPEGMEPSDTAAAFEELAENLRTGRSVDERREAVLRTVACKASIRGGEYSGDAELRALVDRVQSGEIRYCPHGRPVVREIRRRDVEKLFKRT